MDPTFALAALTLLIGAVIFIIRSLFASKCIRFQIGWGCIDVERDVDVEMQDIRQSPGKPDVAHFQGHRSFSDSPANTPTKLVFRDLEKEDII